MLRIANQTIPDGALLAPMAGVTDLPFRLLCRAQGSVMAVTEMVSAKGYLRMPKGRGSAESLLMTAPEEGPVAVQLFGSEPEIMAEAAKRLAARGYAAIDINMGCPVQKVVGAGEGSALMKDMPRAAAIVSAVRRAVRLPVTVKMRIGWDDKSIIAVPFAKMLEAEGADAVAVHGRTRVQFYSGQADWGEIARVKAAVSIPVIGNGDIFSAQDAICMRAETGCDTVMVGRGALGNPWLFAEIRAAFSQNRQIPPVPTARDRFDMAMRHARMHAAWKGESLAVREMRKHAVWYTKGIRGAARMREGIQTACTLKQLEEALLFLLED